MTENELKIENYLKNGDGWKSFIDARNNDYHDATLSSLDIDIIEQKGNRYYFNISVYYEVLEKSHSNEKEGCAILDKKGNITEIKPV